MPVFHVHSTTEDGFSAPLEAAVGSTAVYVSWKLGTPYGLHPASRQRFLTSLELGEGLRSLHADRSLVSQKPAISYKEAAVTTPLDGGAWHCINLCPEQPRTRRCTLPSHLHGRVALSLDHLHQRSNDRVQFVQPTLHDHQSSRQTGRHPAHTQTHQERDSSHSCTTQHTHTACANLRIHLHHMYLPHVHVYMNMRTLVG